MKVFLGDKLQPTRANTLTAEFQSWGNEGDHRSLRVRAMIYIHHHSARLKSKTDSDSCVQVSA